MEAFKRFTPTMIGGAADLVESTKTEFEGGGLFSRTHSGRNVAFGIREHAMGAIVNGVAVHGWMVEKGTLGEAKLDGLGVVAVVAASDTLGLAQTGPAKAVLIVDSRADSAQRDALVRLAKKQGGELLKNVVAVQSAKVDLDVCGCEEGGCGKLVAGPARIETRCLDDKHDKVCGNESAYYPPLAQGVHVRPALAVEHTYTGKGVNETWKDAGRCGAC